MSCRSEILKSMGSAIAAAALLFLGLPQIASARPQEQPTPDASSTELIKNLAGRVDQLNASLEELRAEVRHSHQESRELRQELEATRAQLALLAKREGAVNSVAFRPVVANVAPPAAPQSPPSGEERRLDRLAENQQLLEAKVDDQYQTKVESSSKYRVKLSGLALLNIYGNQGSVDNADLPNLALERRALDSSGSVGATVRQSQLGLQVIGPTLGGARTSANLQIDLFGGFPGTSDGITTGLVRLRTATMQVDWNRTSIVAGQDAPFFSPLSPTSLASLAYPALSYAGNLWTWTPQVRLEHRFPVTENSHFLIAGGILDPLTGEPPYNPSYRYPDAGERSRQPAYATRLAWSGMAWKQPLSFGVGSYYSRQDWGFGRNIDAWAATADWQVPLAAWLALSGEFYRGRALGGLGAAEGRSTLFNGPLTSPLTSVLGLNTVGGWAQLKFHPTERLEFNGAYGEDSPYARDLSRFTATASYADPTLARNQSGFFNLIFRARSNVLFSAEYRRLWTFSTYETKHQAGVINLSMGVLF